MFNKNVLNVNRLEKAQHGKAATAWTRAWLGPSHESKFVSPSQSKKKWTRVRVIKKWTRVRVPTRVTRHTALIVNSSNTIPDIYAIPDRCKTHWNSTHRLWRCALEFGDLKQFHKHPKFQFIHKLVMNSRHNLTKSKFSAMLHRKCKVNGVCKLKSYLLRG